MSGDTMETCEFNLFKQQPGLVHGVFTRSGGFSSGRFDSLNVGMNSGDEKSLVARNRKRIIQKMGMRPMIFLNQVHGDRIAVLKKSGNDLSESFQPGTELYTADGCVTDIPGIFLVIQVADCQSIMLHDPVQHVVANVHSGWRGSIKNIVGHCLDVMIEQFGCRPDAILAGISPSLGPCCAEFINYTDEIPQVLWRYKRADAPYFDFWQMTTDQLTEKGVTPAHIENMAICTKCNTQSFYSYRREKQTGRFACVIAME